jgi:hypothetical protein
MVKTKSMPGGLDALDFFKFTQNKPRIVIRHA